MSKTKKIIHTALDKWTYRLGLRWWSIDSFYHSGKDARKFFKTNDGTTVLARTYSDWRYGYADVHFNLPAMRDLTAEEVERTVVHELCHVLINEMRATGIDHEERTVTGLTNAFFWVEKFSN